MILRAVEANAQDSAQILAESLKVGVFQDSIPVEIRDIEPPGQFADLQIAQHFPIPPTDSQDHLSVIR